MLCIEKQNWYSNEQVYFIEVNDGKKKTYTSWECHNRLDKQLLWQYIMQYAD